MSIISIFVIASITLIFLCLLYALISAPPIDLEQDLKDQDEFLKEYFVKRAQKKQKRRK